LQRTSAFPECGKGNLVVFTQSCAKTFKGQAVAGTQRMTKHHLDSCSPGLLASHAQSYLRSFPDDFYEVRQLLIAAGMPAKWPEEEGIFFLRFFLCFFLTKITLYDNVSPVKKINRPVGLFLRQTRKGNNQIKKDM
jgi:hypothetical protein